MFTTQMEMVLQCQRPYSIAMPLLEKLDRRRYEKINCCLQKFHFFFHLKAEEKLIEAWTKILEICLQLLQQACDHFSKTSTSEVCKEIINCERGSNYLKSLVEVFRVARRLKISLKTNSSRK